MEPAEKGGLVATTVYGCMANGTQQKKGAFLSQLRESEKMMLEDTIPTVEDDQSFCSSDCFDCGFSNFSNEKKGPFQLCTHPRKCRHTSANSAVQKPNKKPGGKEIPRLRPWLPWLPSLCVSSCLPFILRVLTKNGGKKGGGRALFSQEDRRRAVCWGGEMSMESRDERKETGGGLG